MQFSSDIHIIQNILQGLYFQENMLPGPNLWDDDFALCFPKDA